SGPAVRTADLPAGPVTGRDRPRRGCPGRRSAPTMSTQRSGSDAQDALPDEGVGGFPPVEDVLIESGPPGGVEPTPGLPPGLDDEAEPDGSEVEQEEGEELPELDLTLPCIDDRERALPVRQGDLTRLLLAEPGLRPDDRARLAQLGRILGALFHSEFYEN